MDPVLKQRGPQGFVKYLAKYVVVLGIDDREEIFYCYEGNLLVRRINISDMEDILLMWRINSIRRIFLFLSRILTDVEDILLFSWILYKMK